MITRRRGEGLSETAETTQMARPYNMRELGNYRKLKFAEAAEGVKSGLHGLRDFLLGAGQKRR